MAITKQPQQQQQQPLRPTYKHRKMELNERLTLLEPCDEMAMVSRFKVNVCLLK